MRAWNARHAGWRLATCALVVAAAGLLPAQVTDVRAAREADRAEAVAQARAGQDAARERAVEAARRNGWPVRGTTPDGRVFELRALSESGQPLYDEELTTIASTMSNSIEAHGPPLSATGAGVRVGIWDSGIIQVTHQEFNVGGVARAQAIDGGSVSAHGTAVAGVVAAAGVNPEVVGAAPEALIRSWNWTGDVAEATAAAATSPEVGTSILFSNHSYGTTTGWDGTRWEGSGWLPGGAGRREDSKFGRYDSAARGWDVVLNDAPYLLTFWSAGNDRNDPYTGPRDGTGTFSYFSAAANAYVTAPYDEATAPLDDNWDLEGYDTIIRRATTKNVVTVGAIDDAVVDGVRAPEIAVSGEYSGWGPTDDGRIKPDVVANGTQLRVTVSGANDAYGTGAATGTSFSAPNAAGVAAQLAGYAMNSLDGLVLRASTHKALLLHGATDIGRPGPDYQFGWGMTDAVASLEPLARLGTPVARWSWPVVEARLSNGATDSYTLAWDGAAPLVVTICWTDPPGPSRPDVLDDPTRVLVHDLDLRVEGPTGTIHFPFILDPADVLAPATTGDNSRDNVEQVRLEPGSAPVGEYTLRVSHKGALPAARQWYSLVTSGVQPAGPVPPPLALATAEPAQAPLQDGIAFRATGGPFLPGTQLLLRRDGFADIELRAEQAAPSEILAILDVASAQPGFWDLVALRPGGATATLAAGVEVFDPNAAVESWEDLRH